MKAMRFKSNTKMSNDCFVNTYSQKSLILTSTIWWRLMLVPYHGRFIDLIHSSDLIKSEAADSFDPVDPRYPLLFKLNTDIFKQFYSMDKSYSSSSEDDEWARAILWLHCMPSMFEFCYLASNTTDIILLSI